MATVETERRPRVKVCSLAELESDGFRVVSAEGRTVLVLLDKGNVYALDNRCPHMGFPLHRGTVRDGILTCHWHHAKFDLAGGCTFDPFADDVTSFYVEVREGSVWLDPMPIEEERATHWLRKLDDGLKHNIQIVQAKSVIGLAGAGSPKEVLEGLLRTFPRRYCARYPPSTISSAPVTNEDSSDARYRTVDAISSGRANRLIGMRSLAASR